MRGDVRALHRLQRADKRRERAAASLKRQLSHTKRNRRASACVMHAAPVTFTVSDFDEQQRHTPSIIAQSDMLRKKTELAAKRDVHGKRMFYVADVPDGVDATCALVVSVRSAAADADTVQATLGAHATSPACRVALFSADSELVTGGCSGRTIVARKTHTGTVPVYCVCAAQAVPQQTPSQLGLRRADFEALQRATARLLGLRTPRRSA